MNKEKTNPKPFIQFKITERCNYKCEYCVQNFDENRPRRQRDSNDRVVDAFINFIKTIDGKWTIDVIGGEPLMHPRFFEILTEIVAAGHDLYFITNFSFPVESYKKVIDICGSNLIKIYASLHLSQVKSVDDFINKAIEIRDYNEKSTNFIILSVMKEETFETLKNVKSRVEPHGIKIIFQHLKEDEIIYHKYSDEIDSYLNAHPENYSKKFDKIKNSVTYGRMCYAGSKLLRVRINGDIQRCYNTQEKFNILGNIVSNKFKLLPAPTQCLSARCTCPVPLNYNMICFDNRNYLKVLYYQTKYKIAQSFINL